MPERDEAPLDGAPAWRRIFAVRREERGAVLCGGAAFFCVMFGIFLLRPLRDEMGLVGGARNLKYLWTVTLAGTLAASFGFAALASRRPRRAFVAATYRAVACAWLACLAPVLAADGPAAVWIARGFYVVHAVTNVLVVSLFWALLADVFEVRQARRLYGLIAVGGTLGTVAGTAVTALAAPTGRAAWLIVPAALALEASIRLGRALARRAARSDSAFATGASEAAAALPLGGDAFEGLKLVARSPYLAGIAVFTFLLGVVGTFLTYQQNYAVEVGLATREARQAYFAWTENAAQSLTLAVQLLVTGTLMRRLGVAGTLLVLPAFAALAFASLGAAHVVGAGTFAVVTVALVCFRGLNHATLRPAREALYVPLSRGVKFKAKSFTDTFAFRGGDLASIWSFDVFSLAAAALAGVPVALAWGGVGAWLGRRQRAEALLAARDERA